MNDLKYIKLFEAFESDRLSKTLNFIDKDSKKKFLTDLKNVCNTIDFPYSDISDEYIDYLTFKKALSVTKTSTDRACTAESPNIKGEVCKDGMVKRNWGKGTRVVKCEHCGGTGVLSASKGVIKMVKFWFNSEGKYIKPTGVDGTVRKEFSGVGLEPSKLPQLNEDRTLYDVGPSLKKKEVEKLQTGQLVIVRANGESNIIGCIIRTRGSIFFIQNRINGGSPDIPFNHVAKLSWCLYGGGHDWEDVRTLTPKKRDDDSEINPYNLNSDITIGSSISIKNSSSMEKLLADANFALVLDLERLKEKSYTKKSDIIKSRVDRKKGALAFTKEDDIKKENIKRYTNELANSINVPERLTDLNKLVKRMIGFRLAFYLIDGEENLKETLSSVITGYYALLKASEANKQTQVDSLNRITSESFKSSMRKVSSISSNLKRIGQRRGLNEKDDQVLDYLDKISSAIYDSIAKINIETIEDMEIVYQKLFSLRNIFRGDRYYFAKLKTFVESLTKEAPNDSIRALANDTYLSNRDNILEMCPRVLNIVSKI